MGDDQAKNELNSGNETVSEEQKENLKLKANVSGMKYMLLGMVFLELSRLLEPWLGITIALLGPVISVILVIYGVFAYFNFGSS